MNEAGYSDGYRRGTNYCHRQAAGSAYDSAVAAIATARVQADRCTRGEHNPRLAQKNHSISFQGQRITPGTWYCAYCGKRPLKAPEGPRS